jgi:hypothetical protein
MKSRCESVQITGARGSRRARTPSSDERLEELLSVLLSED